MIDRVERDGSGVEVTHVRLDLDDFPAYWRQPASRWLIGLWLLLAAAGVFRLVHELIGPVDGVSVAVAAGQAFFALVTALLWLGMGVRLEPAGYRVGDTLWRGRLRPWTRVAEVRAPGRWTKSAEIRGTRASDAPVALPGMTAELATELQRRLLEARERSARTGAA